MLGNIMTFTKSKLSTKAVNFAHHLVVMAQGH